MFWSNQNGTFTECTDKCGIKVRAVREKNSAQYRKIRCYVFNAFKNPAKKNVHGIIIEGHDTTELGYSALLWGILFWCWSDTQTQIHNMRFCICNVVLSGCNEAIYDVIMYTVIPMCPSSPGCDGSQYGWLGSGRQDGLVDDSCAPQRIKQVWGDWLQLQRGRELVLSQHGQPAAGWLHWQGE